MDSHQAESAAAAYIGRELLRHLVYEDVLEVGEARGILTGASTQCLQHGPTLQRYKEASDLIDRIRDEDFPKTAN